MCVCEECMFVDKIQQSIYIDKSCTITFLLLLLPPSQYRRALSVPVLHHTPHTSTNRKHQELERSFTDYGQRLKVQKIITGHHPTSQRTSVTVKKDVSLYHWEEEGIFVPLGGGGNLCTLGRRRESLYPWGEEGIFVPLGGGGNLCTLGGRRESLNLYLFFHSWFEPDHASKNACLHQCLR